MEFEENRWKGGMKQTDPLNSLWVTSSGWQWMATMKSRHFRFRHGRHSDMDSCLISCIKLRDNKFSCTSVWASFGKINKNRKRKAMNGILNLWFFRRLRIELFACNSNIRNVNQRFRYSISRCYSGFQAGLLRKFRFRFRFRKFWRFSASAVLILIPTSWKFQYRFQFFKILFRNNSDFNLFTNENHLSPFPLSLSLSLTIQ